MNGMSAVNGMVDPSQILAQARRDVGAKLAGEILRRTEQPRDTPPAKVRTGTVTSFSATTWTATVQVAGSGVDAPNVRVLRDVVPAAGNTVQLVQVGPELTVIGVLTPPDGLPEIDASSWVSHANFTAFSPAANSYGPLRAYYDPRTRMIDVEFYVGRITANSASALVHSPIIIPSQYRAKGPYHNNSVCSSNVGGTEGMFRVTINMQTGSVDIVYSSSRVWSIGQFAFIQTGWRVA